MVLGGFLPEAQRRDEIVIEENEREQEGRGSIHQDNR